jgi:transposase InsO family protein
MHGGLLGKAGGRTDNPEWMEARALRTKIAAITTKFMYEEILSKFGCPLTLISDHGNHFLNDAIEYLVEHFLLQHCISTTYYPQGREQAESTNKIIGHVLVKLVNEHQTDWDEHLPIVLFSYRSPSRSLQVIPPSSWFMGFIS